MIRKCDKCQEKEAKHIYGEYIICDECRDFIETEWKSKDKQPKIEVSEESRFGAQGAYQNGRETIKFFNMETHMVELVLNHEVMHHVLNYFISVQASFCFDNIYKSIGL